MLTFPAVLITAPVTLVGVLGAQLFRTPKMQGLRSVAPFGLVQAIEETNRFLALCH